MSIQKTLRRIMGWMDSNQEYEISILRQAADYIDHLEEVERRLKERELEHLAALTAYAYEFALNEDGEPDLGSIHENIRKLKAEKCMKNIPTTEELIAAGYTSTLREYDAECDLRDQYYDDLRVVLELADSVGGYGDQRSRLQSLLTKVGPT